MSNINKIVELLAEVDGVEFDDVAVEIMSLVEEPAIGVHWAAFAAQHLFVSKIPGESQDNYLGRCIPQLISEGYDQDQAAAICYAGFQKFEPNMPHYTIDGTLWEGPTHQDADGRLMTGETHTNDSEYLYHTPPTDVEMIDGIVDLLNQVENIDNRRQMAIDVLKGFQTDGVIYDLGDFVTRICFNLDEACWPGWEAIGLKPKGGRMVPNCVPMSEEKFEINVDGLPNYIDQGKDLREKEDIFHAAILAKASEVGFGEVLDIELTSYINLKKDKFETISDFLRANEAIDVLDQIVNSGAEQMPEFSYRYSGGLQPNSRNFCIAMVGLGKIYSRVEIEALSQIPLQPGMGPNGTNTYNIFDYKGGVNCKHYWEQLAVFRSPGGRNIVLSMGPASGDAGEIASRSNNYWRLSAQKSEWQFAEDDDQMIITGPAMKAFQLIPRRDDDGNLFHVYFSDETIKKLSEKFLKEHKQHMTDINHSMNPDEENTLVESWIVEDPTNDKANALGFNPTKGDWYVSYKINNKETWKQIKEGKLNGFSIAGQFIERTSNKLRQKI